MLLLRSLKLVRDVQEADSDGAGSNPFTAWKEKLSQSLEAAQAFVALLKLPSNKGLKIGLILLGIAS